jgi:hypothetical protein
MLWGKQIKPYNLDKNVEYECSGKVGAGKGLSYIILF